MVLLFSRETNSVKRKIHKRKIKIKKRRMKENYITYANLNEIKFFCLLLSLNGMKVLKFKIRDDENDDENYVGVPFFSVLSFTSIDDALV